MPYRETPESDLPALSLLGDIEGLETRLIGATSNEPAMQALQLVAWEEVGGKVWAPAWETSAETYAGALAGNTPYTLPELSQSLDAFLYHLGEIDGADLALEERRQHATAVLGIALALALRRTGWGLRVLPGDDAVCERQGAIIKPFDIVPKLASGELTPEAWQELAIGYGIADLDLGGGTVIIQEASANQPAR